MPKQDDRALRSLVGEVFGLQVRAQRKKLGLTIKEVAYRMKTSEAWVNKIEINIASPTLVTIVKLAEALETTPSRLLEGVEWPESLS